MGEHRAYAGRCKCGNVVAIMAITDRHREELAETVAEWIRDGLSVEQVTVEEARESFSLCECEEGDGYG